MRLGDLRVGLVETARLSNRRQNPRSMSKQEYAALKRSVERFGFKSFVVVEELSPGQYGIIDGHHRSQLANELGHDRVPVVLLDAHASEADLAMLTFNITGSPTDESYFDLLSDLMKSFDANDLATSIAVSEDFLRDMQIHVDAVHAGTHEDAGKRDPRSNGVDEDGRWQGHPIRIDFVDTPEARLLLAKAKQETGCATDGQAVYEILRRYFGGVE